MNNTLPDDWREIDLETEAFDRCARFVDWMANRLPADLRSGQRVGQSYLNHLGNGEPCPDLFYETDEATAWLKISAMEDAKAEGGT